MYSGAYSEAKFARLNTPSSPEAGASSFNTISRNALQLAASIALRPRGRQCRLNPTGAFVLKHLLLATTRDHYPRLERGA